MTSRRNSAGNGLRTVLILPAGPQPHRQGVNRTGGSPTTYIKAGVGDVARVLAAITGEAHPLAT